MPRERGKESHELRMLASKRRRDVWIFTEGELTEPQYIDIIKALQPRPFNDVHIVNDSRQRAGTRGSGSRGADRTPSRLVDAAIKLKRDKDREAKRAGVRPELSPAVWCLFDRDQHDGVDSAVARALKAGVRVAFSHPCFELWRLLHHQDFTTTCGGVCNEAARRLPWAAQMTAQEGKAVYPSQIMGGFQAARKRARQLNAQHPDHVAFSHRDPYTDVWKFVEDLGITEY
jgi:hypothetical protein